MSIWKYREIRKSLEYLEEDCFSMDEGETTIDSIKDDDTDILIKREDENPSGSWKDRGTAYKMTQLYLTKVNEAVISSSGNAAISYLFYANNLFPHFRLHIVVSPDINPVKLDKIKRLLNDKHQLYITKQTRKRSVEISAAMKIPNLRASIDDEIVKGYWSLGFEIEDLLKDEDNNSNSALFVPVSSGTALVGLAQGLFMKLNSQQKMPKIFICQTQQVHPVVDKLSNNETKSEGPSLADAITDTTALRTPQLLKIVSETNGGGIIISNQEILQAKNFAKDKNIINLSNTSLLALAGYLSTKENNKFKKVICIASGL